MIVVFIIMILLQFDLINKYMIYHLFYWFIDDLFNQFINLLKDILMIKSEIPAIEFSGQD